jgi:hypothetical protein
MRHMGQLGLGSLSMIMGLGVACAGRVQSLGEDATVGGSSGQTGGSSAASSGRGGTSGSNLGGTLGVGSANSGGAATGGAATGGTVGVGGATAAVGGSKAGLGGTSSGGAAPGIAGAAGVQGVDPRCPALPAISGTPVNPTTADFEADGAWDTLTSQVCQRTASSGSNDGCHGSYYLTCSTRKATIDGPRFFVPSDAVYTGHRYYVTALVRFSPATAPTEPAPLALTAVWRCVTGVSQTQNLGSTQYTTTDWVRVGGTLPAITCESSSLVDLYFFVYTPGDPAPFESLDVDDLRVYDMG